MGDEDIRILGEGNWVRLVSDDGWEYAQRIKSRGVVVILAVTEDDELVLVEQYRPAVRGRVIETPAGLIGDLAGREDEDPAEAARRELIEETGFEASRLEYLMECPSSPGTLAETFRFYRAHGLRRVGPGGGDGNEAIEVHLVPRSRALAFLTQQQKLGKQIDTKVFAALYLLEQ